MDITVSLFWLLLAGAAAALVLQRFRPRLAWPTAVSLLGITLVGWLIIRSQIPLQAIVFSWSATGFLPDWTWQIDQTSWNLTLWLLLASTAVSLHATIKHPDPNEMPLAPASMLLLTAAVLSAIWSDSFTGLLAGLTLLLASWLSHLMAGRRAGVAPHSYLRERVLLVGLLLAWPIGSSRTALLGCCTVAQYLAAAAVAATKPCTRNDRCQHRSFAPPVGRVAYCCSGCFQLPTLAQG